MATLQLKDSVLVLPSRGLLYEGKVPDGTVTLKVMTANEIKLLAGARGSGFQVINNILRRLVVNPPMPIEDFLSSDRLAMLYAIRALAYGPEYKFEWKCRSCDTQYADTVNINELDVKYADDDFMEPFTEEIDGSEVVFVLPRGYMEKIAEQRAEAIRRERGAQEGDPYQLFMMAQCLKKWGEEEFPTYIKAYHFLENLPARTYWEFFDVLEDTDVGLPRTITTTCPACGFMDDVPLPISAEFFRPRTKRARRH